MINFNSDNAKLISSKDVYLGGANCPTYHYEYECPCKKGKVIYERVPGFNDDYAQIKCSNCAKKYDIRYGCGHAWELIEK